MVSTTMFFYTTAIDKAFLQNSGTGGVAFSQMSTMTDIWKVRHQQGGGKILYTHFLH